MAGHPFFLIMLTSSLAGLLAGFVMHRSDFCVTATFRDLFLFGDFFLLRMLVLLVVASMLTFELGHFTGVLKPYPFPLLGAPSIATLIGGLLFGIGMVLAGGCVVGSLYKLGSGSIISGVAFLGMILGSAFYAEWHPAWSAFAKATTITQAITLPQALSLPPALLIMPLAAVGSFLLLRWHRQGKLTRTAYAKGHIAPWKTALILAAIGFVSYLLVGMPLGITTSYAKLGSLLEGLFWPEHVAQLAYFKAQPLAYIPPFGSEILRGGAGPAFDALAAIQYPLIAGIILGGTLSALLIGELHLHYRIVPRQYVSALLGGVLLGMAARMVPGCNIWHLWGGLPVLAGQSLLFLLGILPGTWIGSQLLSRFVIR
jgi:uncharacterized protein